MQDNENAEEPIIIPLIEEELTASKQTITTGTVRVDKRVEYRTEIVSMPLQRHTVDVRRVSIGREVDKIPEVRTEGTTTIFPVVEEEIVVTRRLILKEEVHLTREYSKEVGTQSVELGVEHAEITRLDAEGNVISQEGRPGSGRRVLTRRTID